LGDVVAVLSGQGRTDGDAIGIDEDVMFGTGSRAIRGVRASFSPAPTARTDDESTAAREKSSRPASRNFASKWSLRGNRPNRAKSSGCRVKSRVQ
jgi:hypothetical protein